MRRTCHDCTHQAWIWSGYSHPDGSDDMTPGCRLHDRFMKIGRRTDGTFYWRTCRDYANA